MDSAAGGPVCPATCSNSQGVPLNRRHLQWLIAATAICLFLAAVPAFSQIQKRDGVRQSNPAPSVERSRTTTTTRSSSSKEIHKFSTLVDGNVVIREDKPAGQVVDFVLTDQGCVDYVVATYEDEYSLIPFSAVEFRWAKSVVFVDISQSQFAKVMFFSKNDWPDITASSFRDEVFSTFNVSATRRDATRTTRRETDVDVDRRDRDIDHRDSDRRDSNIDRDPRDQDRTGRDQPKRDEAAPDRSIKDNRPDRDARDLKPPPKPAPKPDEKKPAPRDTEKKPAPKKEAPKEVLPRQPLPRDGGQNPNNPQS